MANDTPTADIDCLNDSLEDLQLQSDATTWGSQAADEGSSGPRVSAADSVQLGFANVSDYILNQKRSLLDLPAEIWSKIGQLVIQNAEICDANDIVIARRCPPRQPAITRTCNALRSELLPLYYRHRVELRLPSFVFPGDLDEDLRPVGKWLRAIGPTNRLNLRIATWFGVPDELDTFLGKAKQLWRVPFETSLIRLEMDKTFLFKYGDYAIKFLE